MKIEEIEQAVQAYRDEEMKKVHATIHTTPWWRQTEIMTTEIGKLDHRAARYVHSLGPADEDDAPEPESEPATDTPAAPAAAISPGVKA